MSQQNGDDPVGQMHSVPTGGRGVEFIAKAFQDGTDEVKDLLRYEAEVIYECRYCRNLYRSIANFLTHKRNYCRTLCRSVAAYDFLSRNAEDVAASITADKSTPPSKKSGGHRKNVVSVVQRKLITTTLGDDLNRIDLYSLPNISRAVPDTSFHNGQQWIVKKNPEMAVKERIPDDGAVLVMPQDSNCFQQCGEMTLRRRKIGEVEEKEMTGNELMVLDYIPPDIRRNINPATSQCKFPKCKTTKPFANLIILAYHLSIMHNRPLTTKETEKLRYGTRGDGCLRCFLCDRVQANREKLTLHLKKTHGEVRAEHLECRKREYEAMATKTKRRLVPASERHRSISPTSSDFEDDSIEAEIPEGDGITEETGPTPENPVEEEEEEAEVEEEQKIVLTAEEQKKAANERRKKGIAAARAAKKEAKARRIAAALKRRQAGKNSTTASEAATPRPVSDETLIAGRTKRQHRLPKHLEGFHVPETSKSEKRKQQMLAKSPKKKQRRIDAMSEFTDSTEFVVPKIEAPDEDFAFPESQQTSQSQMASQQQHEQHVTPTKATPSAPTQNEILSPAKSREALLESILKAKAVATSPIKANRDYEDTPPSWLMADICDHPVEVASPFKNNNGPSASSSQPPLQGSSRRKQRMAPTDDLTLRLQRFGSQYEVSGDPESSGHQSPSYEKLPILLTTEEEKIFFSALRPVIKSNPGGSYQCSECCEMLLSYEEGKRHMMGHIKVVRFQCALCDCGAFYLDDLRAHLQQKQCENIGYAPEHFVSNPNGIPCMTVGSADKLIRVVDRNNPGAFRYTKGKIVTKESLKPHRPNPSIETSILGASRNRMEVYQSPGKLFGPGGIRLVHSPPPAPQPSLPKLEPSSGPAPKNQPPIRPKTGGSQPPERPPIRMCFTKTSKASGMHVTILKPPGLPGTPNTASERSDSQDPAGYSRESSVASIGSAQGTGGDSASSVASSSPSDDNTRENSSTPPASGPQIELMDLQNEESGESPNVQQQPEVSTPTA